MSDADIDVNSLVGGSSAFYVTIDTFEWGRNALSLVGLSDAQFDRFVAQLGGAVAAEVLLLMVSKRCGDNKNQWLQAAHLGIPAEISCKRIQRLQTRYNGCIPEVSAASLNVVYPSASPRRSRTRVEANSVLPHFISCPQSSATVLHARRGPGHRSFPSFGPGWLTPIRETETFDLKQESPNRECKPCCTHSLPNM